MLSLSLTWQQDIYLNMPRRQGNRNGAWKEWSGPESLYRFGNPLLWIKTTRWNKTFRRNLDIAKRRGQRAYTFGYTFIQKVKEGEEKVWDDS